MITQDYCRIMARYGAWQNTQIAEVIRDVPLSVLTRDEGAFFGSILGTLNHLLWGDTVWMSRFDMQVIKPAVGIPESAALHDNDTAYLAARSAMDAQIARWADALTPEALEGDLTWYSGAMGQDVTRPMALCVTHMFNHQTHHRGQVHAMLTRAGLTAPVSDLFYLPEVA